jgi:hypothetical protein
LVFYDLGSIQRQGIVSFASAGAVREPEKQNLISSVLEVSNKGHDTVNVNDSLVVEV